MFTEQQLKEIDVAVKAVEAVVMSWHKQFADAESQERFLDEVLTMAWDLSGGDDNNTAGEEA